MSALRALALLGGLVQLDPASADATASRALLPSEGADPTFSNLFLIFSAQRSASTTLCDNLFRHPAVTMYYEALNPAQYDQGPGKRIGYPTHADAIADLAGFMRAWSTELCRTAVCGLKLFSGQVPESELHSLFPSPEGGNARPPTRMIILERRNTTAEFESVRRSWETGVWGTSPCKRAEEEVYHARGPGVQSRQVAESMSFSTFAEEHERWFSTVRGLSGYGPQLEVEMEQLVAPATSEQTMRRVLSFLGLQPAPGVPLVAPEC